MTEQPYDDLDRAILRELERDGRTSFREIARTLAVSEATVRARYRRFTESGALKIVAFVEPDVATSRLALMMIRVKPELHDDLVAFLTARAEVSYVSSVLGSFELFAQVLMPDNTALWNFIQHEVRTHPATLDVQASLEVKIHKLWFEQPH